MRIGIDAKWFFDGPPSGRRVVVSLVNALLRTFTHVEFVIFLDRKSKTRSTGFPATSNVHLCYVWGSNNLISNVFFLPIYARRFGLTALLYQNFSSPFGNWKKVVYNHDVKFKLMPEYYSFVERLYFSPMRLLTRRADGVIAVSNSEKNLLVESGFVKDPRKVFVAYHGVEEDFKPLKNQNQQEVGEARKKYKLPEKYVLFVGRLNLIKNIDNLIRAMGLLRDKNISLLIVGADSRKKSDLAGLVKALGISSRIQLIGEVHRDLPLIYSMASVFCFPSFAESFGLPPLEAMASAVPVVVSNTTALPEVCGEAGTYVDPHQPQMIADAIDNLLINSQLYVDKVQLGLKQASGFTWENTAKAVMGCIESVR